ncbi:MAG: four helix bundle protein [Gemmatimonadetes bacterium]|nr:four helix bundle protein [Gemmatimonadota bacterium]
MGHYRDLKAWQVAHELALEVSRLVEAFPRHERFELTSQLRRASLSVPTNLAEGQARYGPREALRFARIAAGSLAEVDYLLFFAKEKGYLDHQSHERLIAHRRHASRLINKLIRSLKSATPKRP